MSTYMVRRVQRYTVEADTPFGAIHIAKGLCSDDPGAMPVHDWFATDVAEWPEPIVNPEWGVQQCDMADPDHAAIHDEMGRRHAARMEE